MVAGMSFLRPRGNSCHPAVTEISDYKSLAMIVVMWGPAGEAHGQVDRVDSIL